MAAEIFVESKSFSHLDQFLQQKTKKQVSFFVLADHQTQIHCLPLLTQLLNRFKFQIIVIQAGEENKLLSTCEVIWDVLSDAHADRKSLLLNLGGGMITDLGGFSASVYKRGISFIHIPTTLLGMVDASIGGKTGVDYKYLKNHLGTFCNPEAVFIYPGFLETLDSRNKISGIAEVIKHALIADEAFWYEIIAAGENYFYTPETIFKAAQIKMNIVGADPKETGLRKILNFGHTIGHAFESLSLMQNADHLLHGEAVAMGILCESWLSAEYGSLNKTTLQQICEVVFRHFKKYEIEKKQFDQLLQLMSHDKKNSHAGINFNMLEKPGKAVFDKYFDEGTIVKVLDWYRAL